MKFILIALLALAPLPSWAQAPRWGFISAQARYNGRWDTIIGKAEVEIKDGKFKARIDADDRPHHMTIEGTIKGGKITGKATIHGGDADPLRVTGSYRKEVYKDFPTAGQETITLTTGNLEYFFGLTKEIPK